MVNMQKKITETRKKKKNLHPGEIVYLPKNLYVFCCKKNFNSPQNTYLKNVSVTPKNIVKKNTRMHTHKK